MKKLYLIVLVIIFILIFSACNTNTDKKILTSHVDETGILSVFLDGVDVDNFDIKFNGITKTVQNKVNLLSGIFGNITEGTYDITLKVFDGQEYYFNYFTFNVTKEMLDSITGSNENGGESFGEDKEPEVVDAEFSGQFLCWNNIENADYYLVESGENFKIKIFPEEGSNINKLDLKDLNDGEYAFTVTASIGGIKTEKSPAINVKIKTAEFTYTINEGFLETSEIYIGKFTLNGEEYIGQEITYGVNSVFYFDCKFENDFYIIEKYSDTFQYLKTEYVFENGKLTVENDENILFSVIEIYCDGEYITSCENEVDIETEIFNPGSYCLKIASQGVSGVFFESIEQNYIKLPKLQTPQISYDSDTDELVVSHNSGENILVITSCETLNIVTQESLTRIPLNSADGENSVKVQLYRSGYKDSDIVEYDYVKTVKLDDMSELFITVNTELKIMEIEFESLGSNVSYYLLTFKNNVSGDIWQTTSLTDFFSISLNQDILCVATEETYNYTVSVSAVPKAYYYLPGEDSQKTFTRERLQEINLTCDGNILVWNSVLHADEYEITVFNNGSVMKTFVTYETNFNPESELNDGVYTVQIKAIDKDFEYASSVSNTIQITIEKTQYIEPEKPAGSGTDSDPYIVKTPQELNYMSIDKSAVYFINGDIDLQGYEWVPVGDENEPFIGKLIIGTDSVGYYYTIKNLTVTVFTGNYVGLFGCYAGGDLENISVTDALIDIEGGVDVKVGILCGLVKNKINIKNVVVSGTLNVEVANSIGGTIGEIDYLSPLTERYDIMYCVSNAHISFTNALYASGFIGRAVNYSEDINYLMVSYNLLYGSVEGILFAQYFNEFVCNWSYAYKLNYVSENFYSGAEFNPIQASVKDLSDTGQSFYSQLTLNGNYVLTEYNNMYVRLCDLN